YPRQPLLKQRDDRRGLPRAKPGQELRGLLRGDGVRLLRLLHPPARLLRNDGLQVVYIVQKDVVQAVHVRVNVARHGDVNEEERLAAPLAQYRSERLPADDRVGGGGRRDDDVGGGERLHEGVVLDGLAAQFRGHADRLFVGAVGDDDEAHAVRDQVFGGQFAHLARAENQHARVGEVGEDAVRQVYRRTPDGERAASQRGLMAHPLAAGKRLLEQRGQDRPAGPGLLRGLERRAHLTENLRFSQHERVQPGGDAHQVGSGFRPGQTNEV